jgi:uncharacterized repeat protein (TIGR03837 family)
MTWDIFCAVVDNYGDIGVTWRLARQLADEHALPVRLWVDDLVAFHQIRPEIDPARDTQRLAGVEVRRWTSPLPEAEPGDVVIEAMACNLPEEFIHRMAARQPPPVWLNLEYLSAEDWVAGVHGLPSPHPRLPLMKHFFMPGYTRQTGGLTRERWLTAERDAYQAGGKRHSAFPPCEVESDALLISLFSYENTAFPGLLQAWQSSERPVCVLTPVSKALPQIAAWFGETQIKPGTVWQHGALTLHVLPMLDQDTYDRLLWTCDINFVRGEDSFVRAQFAARPMVWQAYVQDAEAHLAKLEAFLDLYCANLDAATATLIRKFWLTWNGGPNQAELIGELWPQWLAALPALTAHARAWDQQLAAQPDLATNLLTFSRKWLK